MPPVTSSFATVTELPGTCATREQISMLHARYRWAVALSESKDVLEIACGPGVGLGYLAQRARRVVGGDYDEALVRKAQAHYGGRIPLLCLDAHALPFVDRAFDVVVLFEALYYLSRPGEFLLEARRVLRPGGAVLVCLPNKDWAGFNPSPFAQRYFSVPELHSTLSAAGFAVHIYGAFPAAADTIRELVLLALRRAAVGMRLVPKTMAGKELLKRLLFGKLVPIPPEIRDEMAVAGHLQPLGTTASTSAFKVLYAVGHADGRSAITRDLDGMV